MIEQIEELKRDIFGWDIIEKNGEKAEAQGHYPKLTVDWAVCIRMTSSWPPKTDDVYDHWFELTGRKDVVEQASEQSFPASDPQRMTPHPEEFCF